MEIMTDCEETKRIIVNEFMIFGDTNRDGTLSKEDFCEMMLRMEE